jgi:uncharacterized RDD family membrane protein YckC
MNDEAPNPYSPPQSDFLVPDDGELKLASPWIRLGAQFIDGLILLPLNLLLQKVFFHVDQVAVNAAVMRGDMVEAMKISTPPFYLTALTSVLVVAALIAINWKFLPNGQTIGKKLTKIQIQSRSGGLLPVNTLIGKRILPVYLVALIPMVGLFILLADILCIFRARHNTLHDDFAGSKVMQLKS